MAKKGQLSKYRPEYDDLVVELGEQALTYTAIAVKIGVHRDTLYEWMNVHPSFSDAMKRSRSAAMAKWEQTLRNMALDGRGNATAAIFAMKNQFPDDYKDRREHKVDAEIGVFEIDFTGFDDDED